MDESPAPVGVRIVIVILLVCGLALAALPLTVLLRGRGSEPGHFDVRNETGSSLARVRIVRVVGEQERLLGAARAVADGASVSASYERGEPLHLRLELTRDGAEREIPLALAADAPRTIHVGPQFGVRVENRAR